MKIAILIPFFGKFPSYAETFFWSAGRNPHIDFFIFTDNTPNNRYNGNIRFVHLTLSDFNSLASLKTAMKVDIKKDFCYKLCDLKPAFGNIFDDYTSGYDYFGYGDLDLVIGNSSKFLNAESMSGYDIISMRKEYLSGSMTVIKNTAANRQLFTLSSDCRHIFEDNRNYFGFDEVGHNLMSSLTNWSEILEAKREIASFTYIVACLVSQKKLRVDFSTKICETIGRSQVLLLNEDGLSEVFPSANKEYLYFHWVNEKKKFHFNFLSINQLNGPLYVTGTGFSTRRQYNRRIFIDVQRRVAGLIKKYFQYYPRRAVAKLMARLKK